MTVSRRSLAAALVALLLACKDSTGPVAGTLKVNLTTPNSGQDGAAIIVLSGPTAPGSVTAGAGLVLWGGPVASATAKVIVTGTLTSGTILTLQVGDVNKVNQYSATLEQVAATATNNFFRRPAPLTGYSLTVTK